MHRDPLRTVRLRPYARGKGPTFALYTWTTGKTDNRGQSEIAYRLTMRENGRTCVVFDGADFYGSPMHADDADATIAALLMFLCLRPGDTDADFFADYNATQKAFCALHAEALGMEAAARFEKDGAR